MISGGITKFAKAHPEMDSRLMVKAAFDAALSDLGGRLTPKNIDGSVISYFADHFACQLKAGAMVQDFVGLCPKPKSAPRGEGFGVGPGSIRVLACGVRRLAEQSFPAGRRKLHAGTRALPGRFRVANISETSNKNRAKRA
jgi:hypothetical protein